MNQFIPSWKNHAVDELVVSFLTGWLRLARLARLRKVVVVVELRLHEIQHHKYKLAQTVSQHKGKLKIKYYIGCVIRPLKNYVSEVRVLTLFGVIIISTRLRLHKSHLPYFMTPKIIMYRLVGL